MTSYGVTEYRASQNMVDIGSGGAWRYQAITWTNVEESSFKILKAQRFECSWMYLKMSIGPLDSQADAICLSPASFECPSDYAKCTDSYCVALHLLCDGTTDCPRGEDELDCGRHTAVSKLRKDIPTYNLLLNFMVISYVYRSFHESGGHSKRDYLQDRANFHRSRAWQIVIIVNTDTAFLQPGLLRKPHLKILIGQHSFYNVASN